MIRDVDYLAPAILFLLVGYVLLFGTLFAPVLGWQVACLIAQVTCQAIGIRLLYLASH